MSRTLTKYVHGSVPQRRCCSEAVNKSSTGTLRVMNISAYAGLGVFLCTTAVPDTTRQDIISGREAAYLQRSASLCCPQSLPQPAAACTPATCQNRMACKDCKPYQPASEPLQYTLAQCALRRYWLRKPGIALLPAPCTTCAGHGTVVLRGHNSSLVLYLPDQAWRLPPGGCRSSPPACQQPPGGTPPRRGAAQCEMRGPEPAGHG